MVDIAGEDKYNFKGRIIVQGKKIEEVKPKKPESVAGIQKVETVGAKPIAACNLEEFIAMTEQRTKTLRHLIKNCYMNMVVEGMRLVVVANKNKKTIKRITSVKYTYIEIQTGYHDFAPRLTAPILTIYESDRADRIERNGVVLFLRPGDLVIKIGDIIKLENI